jgi:formiminotetrahydrofolate cyclodeaminase
MPVRDQTVGSFLELLSARVPAPGGGASAALHAAQSAALLGMVARYSDGPKYAADADTIASVLRIADELRDRALTLAEEDALAFGAVARAYQLPKDTDEARTQRSEAIAVALAGAAGPPARVVQVADELIGLAQRLLPVGNRSVISDVAASAEAARAAATTARVNVEINLSGIKDQVRRADLAGIVASVDEITARADQITAAVRQAIAR